jgi:hypothetical protein
VKKRSSQQNQDDDTTLEHTHYHIFRDNLNTPFPRAQTSYLGVPGGGPAGGAYDVLYSGTLPSYWGGAGYCSSSAGGGPAG